MQNEIKKVTGSLLILKLDTGLLFFAIFLDKTPTGYLDLKVTKFYQIGPTNLPPSICFAPKRYHRRFHKTGHTMKFKKIETNDGSMFDSSHRE